MENNPRLAPCGSFRCHQRHRVLTALRPKSRRVLGVDQRPWHGRKRWRRRPSIDRRWLRCGRDVRPLRSERDDRSRVAVATPSSGLLPTVSIEWRCRRHHRRWQRRHQIADRLRRGRNWPLLRPRRRYGRNCCRGSAGRQVRNVIRRRQILRRELRWKRILRRSVLGLRVLRNGIRRCGILRRQIFARLGPRRRHGLYRERGLRNCRPWRGPSLVGARRRQ